MIKRFFWSLLAILFPWVILLLDDNPGGAMVALVLQATVIGWIPASIWALRVANQKEQPQAEPIKNSKGKNAGE
ncbi:MAG: hypothetical protein H2069_08875 [Legionella sp.]|nr:hypothetical protein [Legionella sp.]